MLVRFSRGIMPGFTIYVEPFCDILNEHHIYFGAFDTERYFFILLF